jgi:Putative zinc-finger
MKTIDAGGAACERIRGHLDSYISNELLIETRHDVRQHLEACPHCTAELHARTGVRARLQAAVHSTPVPDGLRDKVRRAVGSSRRSTNLGLYLMAAAAVFLLCVALVARIRAHANPEDAILRKATGHLAPVLNVGLRDHLHCAIFRKYSKQPETASQMAGQLGPDFAGLAGVLRSQLPGDFVILEGHHCTAGNRQYVHFIVQRGGHLLSVILTRARPDESLGGGLYQEGVDRYQVVGFESNGYLAYVISDLDVQDNLQLAATLAPALRAYLSVEAG